MIKKIGRYEIQQEIGRGGMATVYLASDPRFQRDVAVKVLPRQFTHDPQFLTRFQQEAVTIAALEHPAIVPVYDFGEHEDAPYLVMRYMPGGSLASKLSAGPLPLAGTARILNLLAPALDKAHQKGIIHRDLKPGNVLFDEDDQPYLADFGIARMAEATHTMTIVGTPAYMSPEQVRGKIKLDGRSDLYALGVVLFEMLTARRPYEADTPSGQMVMHLLDPIPDVLALNPGLPAAAQGAIEKAMDKDREERYQSAAELAGAIVDLVVMSAAQAMDEQASLIPIQVVEPTPGEITSNSGGVLAMAKTVIDTPPQMQAKPLILNASPPNSPAMDSPIGAQKTRKPPRWIWVFGLLILAGVFAVGYFAINPPLSQIEPHRIESLPPNPSLGDSWPRWADGMQMVYVPPGSFPMGSIDGGRDEAPVHEVVLDGFWMDRTEVTNAHYNSCVEEGYCQPARFARDSTNYDGEKYPVVRVSWEDAATYCFWAGGRLPTEAQWAYAARGPQGSKYPWGVEGPTCGLAQFAGCDGATVPVGSNPAGASWVGALDMAGNVWEWVQDWYNAEYYSVTPVQNPSGPVDGQTKVLRGGSWSNDAFSLRSALRSSFVPSYTYANIGFRCVVVSGK